MPLSLTNSQQISLDLFGGLCLDLPAQNVPPGISPDCQDVDFVPQSVFQRAALNKLYQTSIAFPVVYFTTYNKTADEVFNLFMDNQGNVYIEDVINTPGQYVTLIQGLVSPNDRIFVTTADPGGSGLVRAWITSFSGGPNGLNQGGSDIPVYYDGLNLTRITQDGPAGNIIISEQVANIAINFITQPALIGPSSNASPITITPTTINFFQNTTGVYTGTGAQTNPSPYINGSSLVFNQFFGNFPVLGYYGPSTKNQSSSSPTTQQQQDNHGNWTSDVAFPETALGGTTGYGFDMNIQGNFIVANAGSITFHIQADDSWIFYLGNGATFDFGPQVGTAPSLAGLPYMASRLTRAPNPKAVDTVVITFPFAAAYPYEFGYGNWKGSSTTYLMVTYDTGNVAVAPTQDIGATQIGNNILPNPAGAGVTLTEQVNTVNAVMPAGVQHPFGVGDFALIQNFTPTQYNGLAQVTSVPDKYSFTFESNFSGLATGIGGTVAPITATCYTETEHGLYLGDGITISQNTQNLYCTAYSMTTGNVTTTNPGLWNVTGVIDPYTFQFDTIVNVGVEGDGGYIGGGGLISPGLHQVCCSFLLDDGSITAPGPITKWNSTGFKKFTCSTIPQGPPNTKGRILHFTGAGGANFFYIPTIPIAQQNLFGGQSSQVPLGTSTVINDNTTTIATFDFADATLFAGLGIDVTGNNLFDQVTLGPSIGSIEYADRLFVWGEVNKVQQFLNMGFNGGFNTLYQPLGWFVADPVNSTLAYDHLQGMSYAITGNSSVTQEGLISQSAYQDSFNQAIVSPNTKYRFRAKYTPVNLQFASETSFAWNYHYFFNQNFFQSGRSDFFQTFDPSVWSKTDPFGNISISGTDGLVFDGALPGNVASYFFNYPVQVPTTVTPGFEVDTSNSVSSTTNYTGPTGSTTAVNNYPPTTSTNDSTTFTGFPDISTANITSCSLNITVTGSSNWSGDNTVGQGTTVFNLSFDGGSTWTNLRSFVLGQNDSQSATFSVPLPGISSECVSLANLALQIVSVAVSHPFGPAMPQFGTEVVNGFISNAYVTVTATSSTPNISYETGSITLNGIVLQDTSAGNLAVLTNSNTAIDLFRVDVEPDTANGNVQLFTNTNNSNLDVFIGSVNANQSFNLQVNATPAIVANVAVTEFQVVVTTALGNIQSANITFADSSINANSYSFTVARDFNLFGSIQSCSLSNWPTDVATTSLAALPSIVPASSLVSGTFTAQLFSPSLGPLAQTSINLLNAPLQGEFLEGTMNRITPNVIPNDLVLQLYGTGIPNGSTIALNDCMLVPDSLPVNATQLRASYVANPTAFDDVTGKIQLDAAGEKIICCYKQRDLLYIHTDHHIFMTQDPGSAIEPSGWTVNQISAESVGALSPYGVGYGRQNNLVLDRGGLFDIQGNTPFPITDELLPLFDSINWDYAHLSWVYNDIQNRKTWFGIPTNGSTFINEIILVNRRGVDAQYDVAEPIHTSTFTSKLLASDKSIKFSPWSPQLNYGGYLNVDASSSNQRTTFAGSLGNMYYLNPNKFVDDDFGVIPAYYTTHFMFSSDQMQNMKLAGRPLMTYMTAAITGTGNVVITPYKNTLNQPLISKFQRVLSSDSDNDLEWNLNITGQRMAFKIQAVPSTTSNGNSSFNMNHFSVWVQNNVAGQVRGI